MLKGKCVTVTGGKGFLGKHLIKKLAAYDCRQIKVADLPEYNLTNIPDIQRMYEETKPQIVIHLAAKVGGIGFNQEKPAELFYDNLIMGTQLLHEAYVRKIEKFATLGTICAYPKFTTVPFKEEDLWNGYPEETNAPYGIAKKTLLVGAQAYREQYELDAVYLLPVNLYGPRDNFNLETSHVIPALIRKMVEAGRSGEREVVLWGDGSPTREFLSVDDCAEAILLAAERYDGPDPVNIGTGSEIPIRELAELVAELTGYDGELVWDTSKPNGQPRRRLDTSRAERLFGFRARTSLREGLERTVAWYRESVRATG